MLNLQGYEMVQGALVRWSEVASSSRPPPTAVLVHGILGSRKNMHSIARRLVQVLHSSSAHPPSVSDHPPFGIVQLCHST